MISKWKEKQGAEQCVWHETIRLEMGWGWNTFRLQIHWDMHSKESGRITMKQNNGNRIWRGDGAQKLGGQENYFKTFCSKIIIDSQEVARKCTGRSHVPFVWPPRVGILRNYSTLSHPRNRYQYNPQSLFRLCVSRGLIGVTVCAHTPAHICSSLQFDLLYVTTGNQDITVPTHRAPSCSLLRPPHSLPFAVHKFLAATHLFSLPIILFR